jgi:hypothetical protein
MTAMFCPRPLNNTGTVARKNKDNYNHIRIGGYNSILWRPYFMMTIHALAPLELSEYLRSFSFSK